MSVACSHSKISRHTTTSVPGFDTEYWKCNTCDCYFYPEQVDQTARNRRDYFAAKAMQAIISSMNRSPEGHMRFDGPGLCEDSYKIADLMMAERSKPHGK